MHLCVMRKVEKSQLHDIACSLMTFIKWTQQINEFLTSQYFLTMYSPQTREKGEAGEEGERKREKKRLLN